MSTELNDVTKPSMGDNSRDLNEDEQREAGQARLNQDEQRQAGQAMLAAALAALGELADDFDEEDQDKTTRRVIRALVAASEARKAERDRFEALKGERPWIHTGADEAVATAFWMWSERVKVDISKVSASSVIGTRLLGLAQGLAAARAMSAALDMLEEEGSIFAFSQRDAVHLALTGYAA